MIDYIKTELILPEFNIKSNPLLEKLREIDIDTGEIVGNHCTAQYKNIKFKMYDSGRVFIDGSLHKLKNRGFHNADDFYIEDMQTLLDNLSQLFELNWGELQLQNVEYGVNIIPPIPSKEIIQSIMFYKSKEYKDIKQFERGTFKRADFQRFSIKCYDKKAQYPFAVKEQTLRWEIQVKKMEYLKKYGVSKVRHLFVLSILEELGHDLISKWDNTLFYDPTSKVSSEMEMDLSKWSNPRYWRILRKEFGKSNRKRISDEVAKMMDYQEYNSSCVKTAIKYLIEGKWESISGVECYVLGPMLDTALRRNSSQSTCELEKEGPEVL